MISINLIGDERVRHRKKQMADGGRRFRVNNPEYNRLYLRTWKAIPVEVRAENLASKKKKNKALQLNSYLILKYGLTLDAYVAMLEAQDRRCASCRIHVDETPSRLHVDHCHSTGKVRGLLCAPCNCAIGLAGDNIESLERLIAYLKRSAS